PDRGAERAVPWNDRTDHADGLLQRVGEYLAGQRVRYGLAVDGGGLTGVIAQHPQYAQPHAAGAADRRAHVEGVERAQFVEMTLDKVGELLKDVLAFIGLELAPWPFERLARRGDRAVDVLGVALRDGSEQFAGSGIAALKMLARRSVH